MDVGVKVSLLKLNILCFTKFRLLIRGRERSLSQLTDRVSQSFLCYSEVGDTYTIWWAVSESTDKRHELK